MESINHHLWGFISTVGKTGDKSHVGPASHPYYKFFIYLGQVVQYAYKELGISCSGDCR